MTRAAADHTERRSAFLEEAQALDRRANRISIGRLVTFLAAVVALAAGISQGSALQMGAATGLGVVFLVLVLLHARVLQRAEAARARAAIHGRHLARAGTDWGDLPCAVAAPRPFEHPYAADIDLLGPGSLLQRIDVTHTAPGERHLVSWLGAAADRATIAERQAAVRELAPRVELRQELEAAAAEAEGAHKLDPSPFLTFVRRKPLSEQLGLLVPLLYVLPPAVLGLFGLAFLGVVPFRAAWGALASQALVSILTAGRTSDALDLVSARRGYAEAFQKAFLVVERAEVESALLGRLRQRLWVGGQPPSAYFGRLDRWAGFAELRHQFPLNIVANLLLLWDLHVLFRLERWARDVGTGLDDAFDALGQVEALASLATLLHLDPAAVLPEVGAPEVPFEAEGLHHPLLPAETRVANDVRLRGPGSALIVTGSNMAGKSTLLRAVGLNVALALAGGPVTARALRVPHTRLRASMRADDSLQRGASYFQAELTKLRLVARDADTQPPVFFLLDELLRGTNARARHVGARSVLLHLLDRGATGLVATHDVALAALEQERPAQVGNVHFTDVMRDGEMFFDYRLRDGVVQTSNALELLRRAGIAVAPDASERHMSVAEPGDGGGGP
ncbi:MAG: MutS-related protein [Myxococcota bacterium]